MPVRLLTTPITPRERDSMARNLGEFIFVQPNATARFNLDDLRDIADTLDNAIQTLTPGMDIAELAEAIISSELDALGLGLSLREEQQTVRSYAIEIGKRP